MAATTINKLIGHPTLPITFDFDDDGRTGYGYLHTEDRIAADVWLYNRAETPEAPDWNERGRMPMPYRNCVPFTKTISLFELPESERDIDVNWIENEAGIPGVIVLLRGKPIAELFIGEKPGKSVMALKDGPVARAWNI